MVCRKDKVSIFMFELEFLSLKNNFLKHNLKNKINERSLGDKHILNSFLSYFFSNSTPLKVGELSQK